MPSSQRRLRLAVIAVIALLFMVFYYTVHPQISHFRTVSSDI